MLFNDRPSFSDMVARAREELHCLGDDDIAVDCVLHLGCPPNIFRRMISIGCADQWDNYVRLAMKSQLQCLDVVIRRVLVARDIWASNFFSSYLARATSAACSPLQPIS